MKSIKGVGQMRRLKFFSKEIPKGWESHQRAKFYVMRKSSFRLKVLRGNPLGGRNPMEEIPRGIEGMRRKNLRR